MSSSAPVTPVGGTRAEVVFQIANGLNRDHWEKYGASIAFNGKPEHVTLSVATLAEPKSHPQTFLISRVDLGDIDVYFTVDLEDGRQLKGRQNVHNFTGTIRP